MTSDDIVRLCIHNVLAMLMPISCFKRVTARPHAEPERYDCTTLRIHVRVRWFCGYVCQETGEYYRHMLRMYTQHTAFANG